MSAVHAAELVTFNASPALDHAIKRIGELARECGDKGREIEKLREQVKLLRNGFIRPYIGCKTYATECDGSPVVLEYEFEPAERESFDCPASSASASVIRVWIGGHGFSYEVFNEAQVEKWEAECLAAEGVGE